ncbi:MAG: nucleoside hydrolase-like domain-containing protein [Prolixibacteraceae bacterium]
MRLTYFLTIIIGLFVTTKFALAQPTSLKPRIINMTDLGADPDDEQSMVRFLVQSNEYDVEGLIVSTGCWKKSQSNINMLNNLLNAYGKVVSLLKVHDPEFPSLEYLQSVSKLGQKGYGMGDVGSGKDSPGSELIIAAVDKDDPRPVWVCFWGGGNPLAQALWKVKNTRSAVETQQFVSKIRVYDVLGQDNAGTWIAKNFPGMIYIRATGVYGWQPSDSWLDTNVQNKGALGAVYPDRKYATEGDSPAFMYLFPNGLNNPDEPWQGSWGGRFDRVKKAGIRGMSCMSGEDAAFDTYYMYGNTSAGTSDISRWSTAYNNDFQARMLWTVTSNYADANHHPIAVVNGDETKQVLVVSAQPGSTVNLSAEGSSDPDGHKLSYKWFYYKDPGTYSGTITVQNSTTAKPTLNIPTNAGGKEIHVILELHDSGSPNLYAYRRVIIHVIDTTRLRVMMSSDFPPFPVTNSDPDDLQSMVRFLLYSNEFDVEGLIASAGTFGMVAEKKNILAVLDKYDIVDEQLRKHDTKYPSADALRAVCYEGLGNTHNISIQWGCGKQPYTDIIGAGMDSEASEAIIAAADKDDPRPIYIGVWGGPREIAQAIWKVQNTRSQEESDAFISKLRVFLIACQDATHQWLMANYPKLFIIESKSTYMGMFGADNKDWVNENIINNHGPLCAIYPPSAIAGEGVIEGDSPSFLYLVSANRGINNPEDPTQESWGGQYVRQGATNHYIDGLGGSTISKWKADFEAEFKERANWCVPDTVSETGDATDVWLEAECGTVGALWNTESDATASNDKYITIQTGNNSTDNAPENNESQATYTFEISKSGTYTLWARVIAPNANDDSFWLSMDNGEWWSWNNIASSSAWTWASNQSYSLDMGKHTLTIGYREDGAKLDKIYLTFTGNSPMGEGAETNNCNGSSGLNLFKNKEKIKIYPKPADQILKLSLLDSKMVGANLSILNIAGTTIQYIENLNNENSIDISGIKHGEYLILVDYNSSGYCQKFLIR